MSKGLPQRSNDFSAWYNELVKKADWYAEGYKRNIVAYSRVGNGKSSPINKVRNT